MKSLAPLALAAVALIGAPGPTAPAPLPAPGDPVVDVADDERPDLDEETTVADLGWLAGVWSGSDGSSDWEAVYSTGAGGHLVGASKELQQGRVVMTDFEHFYERDGELRMTPYPFGKASVEFTLAEYDGATRTAVFENPEHDFPRRFEYRRTGETTLEIALEGDMGGEDARFVLSFARQDV